jgi:serine/threonine protein kinase
MAELSLHGRTKGNDLPAVEDPEAAQTVRLVPADERNPDASSVIIQVTTVSPTNDVRQIGHYAVEQVLNHGGMGVVYKAFDTRLKRPVAVKMILAGAHADPATLARFRGEAEAVALLQHANIVQIHEVAEHGGMPYLAFEFVEGENLQRVVSQRAFSPRDAASLTRTLARAVEFAHQRGIIHRDLKPGNILITPGGVPKITDFGLAKLKGSHDTHTRPGEVIGTPNYMAPEQAEGDSEVIGPSADIYSLGAVLYELLTGQPPFHGTSPMETLLRVKLSSPIPPRHLRPKLPADLETICLKCLEKDPAARYSCAEALAEDLDRFLDGRPIHARPAGPAEHAWKWARRHPTVSVLAFGLATWVVVSYCLFLVQWRDVQRARVELASQAGELNSARAELDVERRAAATARRMADESRRHADWVSYLLQLNAAEREYTTYDAAKARDLLDHCPVALRSWEWHYLRRRIEGSAVTVPLQQGEFLALAGLRGGREIATVANDGRVIRRSVDNGLTVGEVRLGWNAGGRLEAIPARATFSSDGSMIAADCFVRDGAGTAGAHVAVWATATGKLIRAWPAAGAAVRLTFAPDGKRLARLTGEWREVRGHAGWHGGSLALYSLETGSSAWRTELPADSNGYTDVAFDQTPTQLVLTRADKPLTFIDANNGKFVREIGSRAAGGGGICVSHRGPVRYAVRDGSAVNLFDETVKQVGTLTGHSGLLTDARLSDDGRQIITCANDHTLRVWDAESRRTTAVLAGHTATVSTADDVGAGRIASLAQDGQLKIWDVNGVEPHLDTKVVHEWTPAVAFGPDGKWLVSGSGDGQIIVCDGPRADSRRQDPCRRHQRPARSRLDGPHDRRSLQAPRPRPRCPDPCLFA